MNTDTNQILSAIKRLFLENKLLFPGWILMVMSSFMLLLGIAVFLTILSILFLKLDLLTSMLIGFFVSGIAGFSTGSAFIGKVFKDK